jgi:regulator of sigma E protease
VLLILVHELGHFFAAKSFGMYVEEFGIGFPPRLFSHTKGETRYSINAIPLGGFVKLHGELGRATPRSFGNYAAWKRFIVLVAGVLMNFVAGALIFSSVLWVGVPPAVFVSDVTSISPAARAGIMKGDIIKDWEDPAAFMAYIRRNKGKTISLSVIRAGETIKLSVVPRVHAPLGEGPLGISLVGGGAKRAGFWNGLKGGFVMAGGTTWSVVSGIESLIEDPQAVVGPVGIFRVASGAASAGFIYVLQLLGVISINLAVLNLLPIPALDGGRIVLLGIEAIRRKPFSSKFESRAAGLSFALLIALILAVTVNDISSLL